MRVGVLRQSEMFTEMCIYVGVQKAAGVPSVYVFND